MSPPKAITICTAYYFESGLLCYLLQSANKTREGRCWWRFHFVCVQANSLVLADGFVIRCYARGLIELTLYMTIVC